MPHQRSYFSTVVPIWMHVFSAASLYCWSGWATLIKSAWKKPHNVKQSNPEQAKTLNPTIYQNKKHICEHLYLRMGSTVLQTVKITCMMKYSDQIHMFSELNVYKTERIGMSAVPDQPLCINCRRACQMFPPSLVQEVYCKLSPPGTRSPAELSSEWPQILQCNSAREPQTNPTEKQHREP